MMQTHLFLVAVLLAVSSVSWAQDHEPDDVPDQWTRREYPNPQRDVYQCGRYGQASYICDPNHILTKLKADKLDLKISLEFVNVTTCPCSDNACRKDNRGYRILIALMNEIDSSEIEPIDADTKGRQRLYAAELFGYTLLGNWKTPRRCNEDIVIVYSLKDNVLFIIAGETAREKFPMYTAGEISMKYRKYFGSNGDSIAKGLELMIEDIRQVFMGGYKSGLNKRDRENRLRPKTAALTSGSKGNHMLSGLVLVATVVLSLFV